MARQRQQAVQETRGQFISSDTGVAFSNGVMYVNGNPQRPVSVQHWLSSNELSQYTTVTWEDPATGEKRTSCNCRGWAVAKAGQKRCCCHTKDMEGISVCARRRVEATPQTLRTMHDVAAHVSTIKNTRELRSIMLE